MKILFASTVFPHPKDPTRGVYNLALCRALAALPETDGIKTSVRVVAPRIWRDAVSQRKAPRAELDTGAIERLEHPTFLYPPGFGRRRLEMWLRRSADASVRGITRDWKPDVVLSYWADPDGTAAAKWACKLNARFCLIVGGSDVLLLPDRPGLEGLIEKTVCGADLVRTVSKGLVARVNELCPDFAPRMSCVQQGIDTGRFQKGEQADARKTLGLGEEPVFIWVGRLDPVKNHGLLLDAFRDALRALPDAKLLIVGGGPERRSVEEGIASRGLAESVRMVGAVPPEELAVWYRAADAAVLSSRSEGLPNVLRESLACGRPFASVDVGSVREIGDDTCRVLCENHDPAALADAMVRVLGPGYFEAAERLPVRTWRETARELHADFQRMIDDVPVPKCRKAAKRRAAVIA